MNKKITFKSLLLLCALIAGSSSAWADNIVTWNISGVNTTAQGGSNVNTTLKTSSISPTTETGIWTAVAESSYAGSNNGAQLGSGSYTFDGTVSLSGTSIPSTANIKSISITLSSTGTSYLIDATVDDVAFGSQVAVNQKASKTYTFSETNGKEGNSIVLTFSNGGKKNVIITAISVTYEDSNLPTHTATFSVNGEETTQDFAEGATITFPSKPADISGKAFYGWSTTTITGTTNEAPEIVTSATMGTSDVTYYAVFATAISSDPVETMIQTLQYDSWTYGGSTTNKTSYRLFHNGGYVESTAFDLSKLSKVVVYGGTFGGGSYNKLTIKDADNNKWKDVTVSGSSQTGENIFTEGNALSGTKKLRVASTCGSSGSSENGVRMSKVEIYITEITYTYSGYCTTVIVVEAPAFIAESGILFEDEMEVEITVAEGTTVYYNINSEDDPTSNSTEYTGAFTIDETSTIKAIAYDGDDNASVVVTATYTKEEFDDIYDVEYDEDNPTAQWYVRGTVVAASSQGFVLADDSYQIYVYRGASLTVPNVSDKCKVKGAVKVYNGILEFDNNAVVSEATNSNYNGANPNIVDGDYMYDVITDEYYDYACYEQFEGALTKVNGNYFIAVSGDENDATAMISYPTTAQIATLEALLGKTVRVQGYFSGVKDETYYTVTLGSVEVVATKEITGYNNGGGWNLIASPLANAIAPDQVTEFTDNDFAFYRFNQEADLEWENYWANDEENHSDFTTLVNGKGYLYANSEDVTLTFTGIPYTGSGEVELTKSDDVEFSGLNLVGNPFGDTAYIETPDYLVLENGAIVPASRDNNYVEPMEGIFVCADENGETLTFTTEAPESNGDGMGSLGVNLMHADNYRGGNSFVDRAIVRFGEGRQMPKFQINKNSTKVYIPQDGKDYAVACAEAQGELPLNFRANENGQYTLTVNPEGIEMNYLHLIDNMTGANVDLLCTPSYTFTAKTTDYESRFRLVFASSTCEDANGDNETFAFFSNGNLVVNNEGEATLQVIDVMGRVLSSQIISGTAELNLNTTPGVYVLRLVNGNDVKTQKIVVR